MDGRVSLGQLLTSDYCSLFQVAACTLTQTDGYSSASSGLPCNGNGLASIDHEAGWKGEGIRLALRCNQS